jgi:hypothetical protein
MIGFTVRQVTPVIDAKARGLCLRPYPGHPHGCPNFGKRSDCPPAAPSFFSHFDPGSPVYAVIADFDIAAHAERMRERHPEWSNRQLHCCLYWQGSVRKTLREGLKRFFDEHPEADGYESTECPEAMGIDVTATLAAVGVNLEWPPRSVVRKVAFIARPRGTS